MINQAPPTKEDVVKSLKDFCENKHTLPTLNDLLGLDSNELNLIRPQAQGTNAAEHIQTINRMMPPAMRALNNITFHHSENQPLALAYNPNVASQATVTRIFKEILEPAVNVERAVLFIISDSPASGLWAKGDPDLLVIVLPAFRTLSETLSIDDARFPAIAAEEKPSRWRKIKIENRESGWKKGPVFASRINPIIRSSQFGSKLTAGKPDRRRKAIEALFLAASDSDSDFLSLRENMKNWQTAYTFANNLLTTIRSENREIYERIESIQGEKNRADQARRRAAEALQAAKAELRAREAAVEQANHDMDFVEALKTTVANYVINTLEEEAEQQHQLMALPQIADVFEEDSKLWVKTHPLVLQCGAAGKYRATDLRVRIDLSGESMPTVNASHPLANGGAFDWKNSEVPLADKISLGEWRAAVSIVLGQLSAPIAVEEADVAEFNRANRNRLEKVSDDTRVGYEI